MNAVVGSIADRSMRITMVWRNAEKLVVSWATDDIETFDLGPDPSGVLYIDHTYPAEWPKAEVLIVAVNGGEKALCVALVDFVPPAEATATLMPPQDAQEININLQPNANVSTPIWVLCGIMVLAVGALLCFVAVVIVSRR